MNRVIVGIDEAGRGPIAGPVAVAAVALLRPLDRRQFRGVRDSKQLSRVMREHFEAQVREFEEMGILKTAVSFSSVAVIEKHGIASAVARALRESLATLSFDPHECSVILDGALKAPPEYRTQRTIVRGDETELPITLAGIMAKTARDRLMEEYGACDPRYGFEVHKGYGTKRHFQAIREWGVSDIHRASFIHL